MVQVGAELGDDDDLAARDPACFDGAANDVFDAVRLGRVDQAVAALQGVDDGFLEKGLVVRSNIAYR